MPGAEVLRRELLPGLLLKVAVDVLGANVTPGAVFAEDQEIAGPAAPAAHRLDRALDLGVADRLHAVLAALRREVEDDLFALDRDMLAQDRRHPVALVGL